MDAVVFSVCDYGFLTSLLFVDINYIIYYMQSDFIFYYDASNFFRGVNVNFILFYFFQQLYETLAIHQH